MITAKNELWIPDKPPFAITDAPNTDVPINAPPTMSKIVVILAFSLNPIPNERKNKIIDDAPNIMPLWAAVIGRNPCLPCPIAASAMYNNNKAIAAIATDSEIFLFPIFSWRYICVNQPATLVCTAGDIFSD